MKRASSVEACLAPTPLDKATLNKVLQRSFTSDRDRARRPAHVILVPDQPKKIKKVSF